MNRVRYLLTIKKENGYETNLVLGEALNVCPSSLSRFIKKERRVPDRIVKRLIQLDTDLVRAKRMEAALRRDVPSSGKIGKDPHQIYRQMYFCEMLKSSGLKVKEFAELIHISPIYCSTIISGKNPASKRIVKELEKQCGMSFKQYMDSIEGLGFHKHLKALEGQPMLLNAIMNYCTYSQLKERT